MAKAIAITYQNHCSSSSTLYQNICASLTEADVQEVKAALETLRE